MGFAMSSAALFLAAAIASVIAASVACFCGPMDVPIARSSHAAPQPRAGGLALILGAGAAMAVVAFGGAETVSFALGPDMARLARILTVATAVGLLGLADDLDIVGLPVKFAGLIGASILMALAVEPVRVFDVTGGVALFLPYLIALAGSALWVFVVANAVNFMDGSDGMMASAVTVAALALAALGLVCAAPVAVLCGAVLAGALVGFAPFNMPYARVFAGDSGALFAGALLAAGGLDLARGGLPGAVWIAPLLIAPFLADVFATLAMRALRGANLTRAHRDHLYQRLIIHGWPHWAVAALYSAMGVGCALLAARALAAGPAAALAALVLTAIGGLGLMWGLQMLIRGGAPDAPGAVSSRG